MREKNIKYPPHTPGVIPKDNPPAIWLPYIAIFFAALFWGGSFAAMRVLLRDLSPWSVMWLRMAVAAVVILPFAGKLRPATYRKGDWKMLGLMVLFQPCIYFALESNALTFTTSTQAGVIASFAPLMVSLGAWLFLKEVPSRYTMAGLMISIGGIVGLTLAGRSDAAAPTPLLGNVMEILAMTSAAVNLILIKKLSERYTPWTLTACQVVAGFVFFLPGLYLFWQNPVALFVPQKLWVLLYLGAFVSLGAFGLYNWGLSHIQASKASVFINLVPIWAIVFGWGLLNEGLSLFQLFCAVVTIGGVVFSQKKAA